ncbi:MAG: cytidine deaminase [Acidobacteria bacterium]|nr:cytidine deaminase [Acidobacteriota bacterium]
MSDQELIEAATQAREQAYAPYSHFKVGAAILTAGGQVYSGGNVENSSYGLGLCAERVALFKAVSEGYRQFPKLCLVADTPQLVTPCGACRQVLVEFCEDLILLLANLQGNRRTMTLRELLPAPFDGRVVMTRQRGGPIKD